jgi:hypothetical protein
MGLGAGAGNRGKACRKAGLEQACLRSALMPLAMPLASPGMYLSDKAV